MHARFFDIQFSTEYKCIIILLHDKLTLKPLCCVLIYGLMILTVYYTHTDAYTRAGVGYVIFSILA